MPTDSVSVFLDPALGNAAESRLTLSVGTVPAEALELVHGPFLPGARLPQPSWRSLSSAERTKWLTTAVGPSRTGVALVVLPPEILKIFERAGLHELWTMEEARRHAASPELTAPLRRVRELLEPFRHPDSSALLERPLPRPRGLFGSTVDWDRGSHYVGLHVDSWTPYALEDRHLAPGRLCINVGSEDRFFLFVPRRLSALAKELGPLPSSPADRFRRSEANRLATDYMSQHPDAPVLALRVRPGEAYAAPTENLIHDGSTQGQTKVDWTVTWRGAWSFNNSTQELKS